MLGFFEKNSEEYRRNAISLAKTEAVYFPSMALLIGLSTLITIMIGGFYVINGADKYWRYRRICNVYIAAYFPGKCNWMDGQHDTKGCNIAAQDK